MGSSCGFAVNAFIKYLLSPSLWLEEEEHLPSQSSQTSARDGQPWDVKVFVSEGLDGEVEEGPSPSRRRLRKTSQGR